MYNRRMTELEQAYADGVAAERDRIIEIIRGFDVLDMQSPETRTIIKFPTEDLVLAIIGE